ncbi:MAG: hypothetical protein AABY64_12675 [Bdellovibrionota bacterium]|mgnify:CR=1 FL=1
MKAFKELFQNESRPQLESMMFSDVAGCTTIYYDSGLPMLTVISLAAGDENTDLDEMIFVLDHDQQKFFQGSRAEWNAVIRRFRSLSK